MKCSDCKYGRIVAGECRRRAPQVTTSRRAIWPQLTDEHGCGEFNISCAPQHVPVEVLGQKAWTTDNPGGEPLCERCGRVKRPGAAPPGAPWLLREEVCACNDNNRGEEG